MQVKLKDIAEMAGVSVSTASNALNGYTKSRIARDTLERVNRIANEMGYRPNAIARSLKFQRTDTIAFYTGYGFCDVRDRFLGEVVTGMQHACDQTGLDLLLFGNLTKRPVTEIHRKLTSGKVDGVIVHAAPNDPVVDLLAEGSMPAIAIADVQPCVPSIVADDAQGMEFLVDYLWSKGHRKIAFALPHYPFASVELRRKAFETALIARGGEPSAMQLPWEDTVDYMKDFMSRLNRPTAVACWHDDTAYYLLETCLRIGIRVPEDLAVTGFDGLQEGRIPGRKLVTVSVPWLSMSFQAASNLVKLRDGDDVDRLHRFPVTLKPGDTA
jgi:DNA-binding LacI/PurR family transcriptional regulator